MGSMKSTTKAAATKADKLLTIEWDTTDLSREDIARYFGMGVMRDGEAWIARILEDGTTRAIIHCESRAHGAWMANERESYAVHRSLAALLRSGVFS